MAVNNQVHLIGNLASEVELREFGNGGHVGKFSLAVDRIGDKRGGTDFIRIVVWGPQAVNTAKYCSKGSKVSVAGRLRSGSYQKANADGELEKRYSTEVIGEQVEFLSRPPVMAGAKGKAA
jgi:single-strand DNA-binding protein